MSRKVLVVDDNLMNRRLLSKVLKDDYDVMEAANGKEALSMICRHYKVLSAILLDIMMPEMDGYEVLRHLRENAPLSQLPVIMVTASEDEEARVKALSLGANDFILKPFNPEIVRHCLRNCITLRETASILNAIQKDKLTGLYNREAFFDKVDALVKEREPGYYILSSFDIDRFKLINDQYGAAEGDRILREIGDAVRRNMDDIAGIAGRISADNFSALFPARNQAMDILQRIQEKKLVTLEQQPIVFSVGRYAVTDLSLPASALYDRAYIAKQSVKGRFDKHMAYFDERMLKRLLRDQQIISEMEYALAQRQFEVWFQPQYNHVAGTLCGAEALVRWRHPQKGIVPPGEFIPLFEQNGFVYELDKFVWQETCRLLRKWMDQGFVPLPVSVNISRYDIFRSDLIDVITGLIKTYGIPIDLLRLEITESAFAESSRQIVRIVKKLIELGFTVEIDDFGSGYSSLNTLKSVPAQVVKLDMRFLEEDDDSQRGGNILESIVRMTKWLGMAVIAEGVETREQGDFLKTIGCSHVQGYLYAKPMSAADYEKHFQAAAKEKHLLNLETVANLDNNRFWNPQSMDTLIFNSYVGAACIYEYHSGRIELVRATDKYARMLSGGRLTIDDLLKLDLMQYLDQDNPGETLEEITQAMQADREITREFRFLDLPGCPHETFVRSTLRIIASVGDRYLAYCLSENITRQRVLERKERRVAKQLRAVMDNINCGLTAVAMEGDEPVYLMANDQFYQLLGYTKEQYGQELENRAFTVVCPEDRKHVTEIAQYVRDTGVPISMEYRVTRRDGAVIWLRSRLSMAGFEESTSPVQLCTYTDITAEKRTAQSLLDNLPCGAGICVATGGDAHMSYMNKRFYSYFSHRSQEERAASVYDAIHPDDRQKLRQALIPALSKGGEGACVVRIQDGPNRYLPFRVTGVAMEVLNAATETNSIYVTFVPISDEELTVNEMLPIALAAVMASSSDLSFVKDRNLRYICCSHAFAAMVGLTNEREAVGKTDYDLFEKSLADRYVADDRSLMKSGKSIINMLESLPSADGRNRFSCTSKYLLYDSAGNVAGIYGNGRDVTQAREAESQQQFLVNSIPGGVATYTGQWSTLDQIKLSYFSDGFCRLFGYTREEYAALSDQNPTSLILEEYLPAFTEQVERLIRTGTPIDYIYRARVKNAEPRWIHVKAVLGESSGDALSVNAVFFDVTERQNALEKLRISEEENRLAIHHSQNVVCRYDVAAQTLRISSSVNPIFSMPALARDVPYGQVRDGSVSPETADAYIAFYESIMQGQDSGELMYQRRSTLGWRWVEAHFSTIFSSAGKPISAVISFQDVTESLEKDTAYKKWLQALHHKAPGSYSLLRFNLSQGAALVSGEGGLFASRPQGEAADLDGYVARYVSDRVLPEDREKVRNSLNASGLLAQYRRGDHFTKLEYREALEPGEYRWLRLTVEMVEHSHSSDVEAYLLFENIDDAKRAELLTIERAETDPLTGLLNRTTFAEKADQLMAAAKPPTRHALLMLDLDGFKLVNDVFGHSTGDQTLLDTASLLRTVLRRDDLVGRLGGDEFVIFLNDVSSERGAAEKAKLICELARKTFSDEVQISGSVGIAMYPQDGDTFEALYAKADETLYHVKDMGRDSYAFYRADMTDESQKRDQADREPSAGQMGWKKRRMLIVDDNALDRDFLANLFRRDFLIEKAADGNAALIRLRHYGSAISVVLLDLMMPGTDGFAVLDVMRQSPEMSSIPVVVVSGADDRDTSLQAIRVGASDFVVKPVDPDVLRIRVQSAISKTENERLRAKNNFLELQRNENVRYETVLSHMGLGVVEVDWGKGTFIYSPNLAQMLAGTYDDRTLWHILLTDMVMEANAVQDLQLFLHAVATDRSRTTGETTVKMRAAGGAVHSFHISIYKTTNAYGLAERVLLIFRDLDSASDEEA